MQFPFTHTDISNIVHTFIIAFCCNKMSEMTVQELNRKKEKKKKSNNKNANLQFTITLISGSELSD